MDAAISQRLAAADVVLPKGVAAIDDDVAGLHQFGERLDRRFRDLARRQHHPGGARLCEPGDEILQRVAGDGAVGGKARDSLRVLVVDDRLMSRSHQPADDIAAHPPQADHAELHFEILFLSMV